MIKFSRLLSSCDGGSPTIKSKKFQIRKFQANKAKGGKICVWDKEKEDKIWLNG